MQRAGRKPRLFFCRRPIAAFQLSSFFLRAPGELFRIREVFGVLPERRLAVDGVGASELFRHEDRACRNVESPGAGRMRTEFARLSADAPLAVSSSTSAKWQRSRRGDASCIGLVPGEEPGSIRPSSRGRAGADRPGDGRGQPRVLLLRCSSMEPRARPRR